MTSKLDKEFDEIFSLTNDLVSGGAIINKNSFKRALKAWIKENYIEKEEVKRMLNISIELWNEKDNKVLEEKANLLKVLTDRYEL